MWQVAKEEQNNIGGWFVIDVLGRKWAKVPLTVKVSTSYAICSILQKCLSFITLPLFTRLLTTEQYGQYTIYSSWYGILMIFLTLNLAYGSFQTAMVKFENRRTAYIASVQGICLLLSFFFMLIYFPFRIFWNKLFELPTGFVILMVSEIVFSTSTQLWMEKNRFEFKYKSVVLITLLTSILSPVLAFILVSLSEEKGYARILGYAIINIIVGLLIFILNIRKGEKLYNKEFWKYAFGFNIPLLAYYLSQVIFNQSDRIMISHMTGTGDAAMYGVAYNLAMAMNFILNAINGSYVPWFYGRIKEGNGKDNKSVSLVLIVLIGLMIMVVIWYAPEIILLMAGREYSAATYVVAPVAMSLLLLFYCQLFINVEFYYEEKRVLIYGALGAALLNIILNYLLIPVFGFVAAGYTTLASYIVFAGTNYFTMCYSLRKHNSPNDFFDYKWLLVLFLFFMFSGFLGVVLYRNLVVRIIITIFVFFLMLIFRDKFLFTLKKIRGK